MFIGHFAVGLALKRATPRTSLGVLVAAPQLLDLLWPWFLLLGWERVHIEPANPPFLRLGFDSYPISHSLVMAAVWGLVFASIFARRARLWWILVAAVVSHWVLDWVTHRPDLPLAPWRSPKAGLGLWYSTAATLAIEFAMFAAGVWLYVGTTRDRGRPGHLAVGLFAAVLALIYVGSVVGPPPPDVRVLATSALAIWLVPLWAWWIDRRNTSEL